MAFTMMSHALRMLWANLGNAARVSIVPIFLMYLVLGIVGAGGFFALGGMSLIDPDPSGLNPGFEPGVGLSFSFAVLGFGLFLIAMVFLAWIAIAWHRFILLEEYPTGWIPPFRWNEIKSYIGKLIVLSLIFMVVAIVPLAVLAAVAGADPTGGGAVIAALALLVMLPLFLWVSFRLSSVLPATAVERPMAIGEAWRETASHSSTIFWFGLVYLGVSILIQIVIAIFGLIPFVGALIGIFGSWFTTILGFSALTTVYGVAVEGRELT